MVEVPKAMIYYTDTNAAVTWIPHPYLFKDQFTSWGELWRNKPEYNAQPGENTSKKYV